MKEFLFFDNWFDQEFQVQLGTRHITFKTALNLLLQSHGKTIVETGTMRKRDFLGDGGSTFLFGKFSQIYGTRLYTIDISKKNIDLAKKLTKEFDSRTNYIKNDAIKVLKNFKGNIDLLYLDSFDCPATGDAIKSQTHQLKELKAAWNKLANGAIILLDDNNFVNGGKTKLAKDFLLYNGCTLVIDAYQSLWIKSNIKRIILVSRLKQLRDYLFPEKTIRKKLYRNLISPIIHFYKYR